MYDRMEQGGIVAAPGSAHKGIVYSLAAAPPWWVGRKDYEAIGIPLPRIESAEQAFEALGPYTLRKEQVEITVPDGNIKRKIKVPDVYAVVRSDTNLPFPGVSVSQKYSLIQPRDGFATTDEIVRGHNAEYQIMGELAGGAHLWATLALDLSVKVAGEELNPYLLYYTAHDGSGAEKWRNVVQRGECRNTLNIALRESARQVVVSHIGNIELRHKRAAKFMRDALGYMTEFEVFSNQLARAPFGYTDIGKLTDHLFPLPEEKGRARTNAERAREQLLDCFRAPNLENIAGTAWAALNAVSDFNEHHRRIRNGNDDVDVKFEKLFRRSFEDFTIVDKAQAFILEQAELEPVVVRR